MKQNKSLPVFYFGALKNKWNQFAENDPLWSILGIEEKRGNKWNLEEFKETGRKEINNLMQKIKELKPELKNGRALDFGCGIGRLTQPLSGLFEDVHGVDVSKVMIDLANKHSAAPNVHYHANEKNDLGIFPNDYFDLIYSNITLQHMKRKCAVKYIEEFSRILNNGGILVFQVAGTRLDGKNDFFERIKNIIKNLVPFFVLDAYRTKKNKKMHMDIHGMTPDEVKKITTPLGLKIIKTEQDNIVVTWTSNIYFLSK